MTADTEIADKLTKALTNVNVWQVAGDGLPYVKIECRDIEAMWNLYDCLANFSSLKRSPALDEPGKMDDGERAAREA